MSRHRHREDFDRALDRLGAEGWQVVDAERFESDTESSGLLSPPSGLAEHFGPNGVLAEDVILRWRGCVPSMIQSAFAREGLVVSVPGQGAENYDALLDMDKDELSREYEASLKALLAAVHGTNKPEEGAVTCLATGRSSDLCRITEAFDRLVEHGYIAEPALWPTTSGCWEHVHNQTKDGQSRKAVFWNTQSHEDCFDHRGDLVGELHVHWAGNRDLIAEILADTGLAVKVPKNEGTTFLLHPIASIASTDMVDVVLESAGDNHIQVIKVARQVVSDLGIVEARKLVQNAPKPIMEKVAKWVAKAAKEKLEAAGAKITLKRSSVE
ncbi:ribosomal protein L7/L12 [Micromonospora sp. NPDC047074]|uniref:ribosomal protein L7/L12 n=1 Tax=Micromonospora sp. NPDC047074 TaxID=3154339 RepID=UPI0034059776